MLLVMLAVASTLAQDTDTHNAVLSAPGEAGGPLSDEILSVLEPPLRHVPLQQELVVGNMMMTHTPKECAALKVGPDKLEVGGPLVNFNNGQASLQYACESLSSVRIGTIQQLPSGGIQVGNCLCFYLSISDWNAIPLSLSEYS